MTDIVDCEIMDGFEVEKTVTTTTYIVFADSVYGSSWKIDGSVDTD